MVLKSTVWTHVGEFIHFTRIISLQTVYVANILQSHKTVHIKTDNLYKWQTLLKQI